MCGLSVLLWAASGWAAEPEVQRTVLYVDDGAAPGGDGLSWGTSFVDLQAGMDAAAGIVEPVEVWVAAGTY